MDKILKERIEKGEKASLAESYIMPLLENYRQEILLSLEKGADIKNLHGKAYIIKQIIDDIKRDKSQAEDAKNIITNKLNNKV